MRTRTKPKETEVVELTPLQQQIVEEVDKMPITDEQLKAMEELAKSDQELEPYEKQKELLTKEQRETIVSELTQMSQEMGFYKVTQNPMIKKEENYFLKLRQIDVGEHIEKKSGLSYLSWAYAVDLLYQHDPNANYEFLEPTTYPDGSMMVWCRLTAFGKTTTQYLPVMDYKNKAVINPSATDINKAMQRCLAKAIAVGTGLGLYIYRGEDIPVDDTVDNEQKQQKKLQLIEKHKLEFQNAKSLGELKTVYENAKTAFSNNLPSELEVLKDQRKNELKP